MKYAHVRTEAVLPSGRGTATRGTLHWEQWNGWQGEEKVLAEPSAASLGVQTACMGAACRGVAGRGYRVSTGAWLRTACGFIVDFYHSIWIIISGSALFAHRAFCGYEIRRLFFYYLACFLAMLLLLLLPVQCLCCLCLCACLLCICIWMRRGNICSLLWGTALAYALRVGNHF